MHLRLIYDIINGMRKFLPYTLKRTKLMGDDLIYRTVCFTGHRHFSALEEKDALDKLDRAVRFLVEKRGTVTFRAGGAMGFDTMAAYTVIGYRHMFPQIKLELYLPCPNQTLNWGQDDVDSYNYIKAHADRVIVTSDHYFPGCMHLRNRRLVDGSDVCVAYCRGGTQGGTVYTVDYAERHMVDVINLCRTPSKFF